MSIEIFEPLEYAIGSICQSQEHKSSIISDEELFCKYHAILPNTK